LTPRTLTDSPTDRRYWKRLLRFAHLRSCGDPAGKLDCARASVSQPRPPEVSTQTARQTTLPTTWLGRTLRLQYVGAFGEGMETSGILLDLYPFGLVVNITGAKTVISWERVVLVELVGD
jgi:hypothetical protein